MFIDNNSLHIFSFYNMVSMKIFPGNLRKNIGYHMYVKTIVAVTNTRMSKMYCYCYCYCYDTDVMYVNTLTNPTLLK